MSGKTSLLRYLQLAWMSGPRCERRIYRHMVRSQPRNLLEIGLGMGVRSLRMFQAARRYCEPGEVRYTGIDLFEGRPEEAAALGLKDAYTLLRSQGVSVRLVPGDPAIALQITARTITNSDLVIIDSSVTDDSLSAAWKWLYRLMHGDTAVFRIRGTGDDLHLEQWLAADVENKIGKESGSTRAA